MSSCNASDTRALSERTATWPMRLTRSISLDEDDVRWPNRRRAVARQILELLKAEEDDPGALLPFAPTIEHDASECQVPTLAILYAVISAVSQASDLIPELHRKRGGVHPGQSTATQLMLVTRSDLDRAVNLGEVQRRGATQRTQHVKTLAIGPKHVPLRDAAAAILNEWLSDAGYRGYGESVYSLWRPRQTG
ncbi:hypothetical protein ACQP00_11945 [Dactylosporangium sp. CS-047395]|uniref:hypothetical protein n=1 Tax=Dactylosporangium sp. CS-047395 TaxID=3239936 RepID=UPI003D8E7D86